MRLRDWTVDFDAQTAEHKSGFAVYLESGMVMEVLEFPPDDRKRLSQLCRDAERAYRIIERTVREERRPAAAETAGAGDDRKQVRATVTYKRKRRARAGLG